MLELMLLADRTGALGRLLAIVLALLLAPSRPLRRVELAVVISVDLVEALPIEPVAFLGGHCRQLIVIGLAALEAGLLGIREAGSRQLPCQSRLAQRQARLARQLALRQIVKPEIAVLLEADRFARGR